MRPPGALARMYSPLNACRYAFIAVAELHRRGFGYIRVMPFYSGGTWAMIVGTENFGGMNGSFVKSVDRPSCLLISPTSDVWREGLEPFEPWRIADHIQTQLGPNVQPIASRTPYVEWYGELTIFLSTRPSCLPSVLEDGSSDQVWIHSLASDMTFPIAKIRAYPTRAPLALADNFINWKDPAIATAQKRPPDAPNLLWYTNRRSESTIDDWWEVHRSSEPKERP